MDLLQTCKERLGRRRLGKIKDKYHFFLFFLAYKIAPVFRSIKSAAFALIIGSIASNFFMGEVNGRLPEDKEKLLKSIDRALTEWRLRGEPKRNPFLGSLNQFVA